MRLFLIISAIVAITVVTGCGAVQKNRAASAEPAGAAPADQPSPGEEVHDVAPFGNAALAGKPEGYDEAEGHVWDFRDATTWLLGELTPSMLANPPHEVWYIGGYTAYQPDQEIMAELMGLGRDDLTITIVLGTWCPDSRREVPRFLKITDLWGFPRDKIRFIGVDINKIAPLEDYRKLAIERVPTFIFFKNNIEKGRIIEVPVTSLEQDTRDILKGN
ncbi:MAG: thioredoxin family protein [Bacteroidales bacterium]|jgi:thiol-disulfide isomerase/thioredoxin|nr:thioredoxin family protein [Bacteroidales bacterium]